MADDKAHDDYKEGHDRGEADRDRGALDRHVSVWRGDYDNKSESWKEGQSDGKEGTWDPPGGKKD